MPMSLDAWYKWRTASTAKVPWLRKHGLGEFYQFELRQLQQAQEWRNILLKSRHGQKLPEVKMYVLPVALSPSWEPGLKDLRTRHGRDLHPFTLSGLPNGQQVTMLAFHEHPPEPYSFIRVTSSEKSYIHRMWTANAEYCIVVNNWEHEKTDALYIDTKREKDMMQKMIVQSLDVDDNLALSLQAPLTSAPKGTLVGGVSYAATSSQPAFNYEFLKAMQFMAPPELRTIAPPKLAIQGKTISLTDGYSVKVAEKYNTPDKIAAAPTLRTFSIHQEIRKKVLGEYSIESAITMATDDEETYIEFMNKTRQSEIVIPEDISKRTTTFELQSLSTDVNEDTWSQLMAYRSQAPPFSPSQQTALLQLVEKDLHVIFAVSTPNQQVRQGIIDARKNDDVNNILRIAQSIARARYSKAVEDEHIKQGRGIWLTNLNKLLLSAPVRAIHTGEMSTSTKEDKKIRAIRSYINDHPGCSAEEIFENVASLFQDYTSFSKWLHQMYLAGKVSYINEKYYL